MKEKLESMLSAATEAGSKNTLSAETIHQWLTDYLESYQEELKRFPEISKEPHFDLIMADHDLHKEGLFVVAVLNDNNVSLLAGRGPSHEIRGFVEREFPENALDVIPELRKRFHTFSPPLIALRTEIDAWMRA
jgi:hypothetical protein